MNYQYRAYVTSVYDGDTITVDIDLGFGVILRKQKLRFRNVNTPEVRGDEKVQGKKVRDEVRSKILNKNIEIVTYKDKKGKYGRWLADVFYTNEHGLKVSLNKELIEQGYYKKY